MITSGLVPGVVMYKLLDNAAGVPWGTALNSIHFNIAYLGFAVTLASAYRLARFNIDSSQSHSFKGLPTPANTIFILSLPLILLFEHNAVAKEILTNPYVLLAITLLSCWALNARFRLFALKFKTWGFAENKVRYIFILLAAVSLIAFGYLGIPLSILLYVGLSLVFER